MLVGRSVCLWLVSRDRPFTDSSQPVGRQGSGHPGTHFGDFPHDSWRSVLPSELLMVAVVIFIVQKLLTQKQNVGV